jgi:UDP-glucose 4-epimerase
MNDPTTSSILISGAAGFLGAHLTRTILNDSRYDGHDVLALDDLSGGFTENLPDSPRIRFVNASVTDSAAIDQLFQDHHIQFVFHLAAYAAEGLSHFIRRFNYTNNLIGSVNLINASVRHDVQHFMFTSSIAVYGAAQVPMREDMIPVPEDPYGISKLAVELDLQAAKRQFELNYTVFRPHNVYGEYQNIGDRYRNVVGIFMNRIMQKQPLPVFGDGKQKRAFSYVGDLMPAFVDCPFEPEANGNIFNIGAATPTSVLELAEAVCREFDVEPKLDLQPTRNEVENAWSDHSKCERVFGPPPSTSLEEGIHRMANWARQVGARSSSRFRSIEIERGLPPGWTDAVD